VAEGGRLPQRPSRSGWWLCLLAFLQVGREQCRGSGPNVKRHARTSDAWAATVGIPHRLVGRDAGRMHGGQSARPGLGNAGGDKWSRQERGHWQVDHTTRSRGG
jgi:hypothetical protein